MSRHATRILTRAVAAVLATALSACGAGSETGTGADSLSIGFALEPENLDFTKTDGAAIPQVLLVNVYEGLVQLDANGKIAPLLAESWTVSPDNRTYTFKLQEGVTFSNGDEFSADSVKFSIERVMSEAWTISLKSAMDVVESVEAVSPTEVEVNLSRPSNDWLFRMTTRIGAMMTPDGVSDLANKPVGTGPFTLDKWTRGDSIVLKRRADYWGTKPGMSTVTFKYFNDPNAMTSALLSDGIDVISTVQAPDTLTQFESDGRFKIIEGTSNGEVTLSFNNAAGPLKNEKLRQAVKYALDRQAIVDTASGGYGTLIGSMVPPTDPWFEDLTGLYPYDPEKAKDLLAQAGQEKVQLRLRLPNVAYAVASGQVVKSQLAEVGIDVTIDVLEFPARWVDEVFTKHDYDMSIISHVEPRDIAIFGDPDYYFGYDSTEMQDLLASADAAGTPEQQVADLKKAARTLADDAAADWLFLIPYLVVADVDVEGLPENGISESFDVTAVSR